MEKKRNGNLNCCVRVCKNTYNNTSEDIKFYAFPKAEYKVGQRDEWKRWIRKTNGTPDWEPKVGTRICSEHFAGNCVSPVPKSPSYAPFIVERMQPGMLPEETSAIKRFERSMNRRDYTSKQAKESVSVEQTIELVELASVPVQIDAYCQVQMFDTTPEHIMTFNGTTTMICMQFVRNGVCEAQTQAFIPDKPIFSQRLKKRRLKEKCIGTSTARIDKFTQHDDPNSKKRKRVLPSLVVINNDFEMLELCGVTMDTFQMLYKILPDIPFLKRVLKEDRLFLVLTKLKCGISFSLMSSTHRLHRQTVTRTFDIFLRAMASASEQYIKWPSREAIRNSMPEDFKPLYEDCRVMIYCMKIILQPGGTVSRVLTNASYGGSVKFLVGWTPNGVISFVSSSFNGLTGDCDLIEKSGILDLLEPGDVIIANKEFPEIQRDLQENRNITIKVLPSFLRNSKFSAEEVEKMYKNERVKNHYDQSIGRLKYYKVLHSVSIDIIKYVPDMFFVCCALANLQLPNVLSESKDTQYSCSEGSLTDSDIEYDE